MKIANGTNIQNTDTLVGGSRDLGISMIGDHEAYLVPVNWGFDHEQHLARNQQ